MRLLVTGGSGFIGRACLAALGELPAEVHAVARTVPAAAPPATPPTTPPTTWHAADLLDDRQAGAVVAAVRPTHLLHLAWEATPGRFWAHPDNLRWAAASVRLVQAFAEAGGQRLVAAGTCAEYDWAAGDGVFAEDAAVRPATLYGVCKNAVREVVEAFCPAAGVGWCWGRVFFPYGPGEPPGKLVGSAVAALRRGEPARCTAGTQVRDFIHVDDVAGAFVRLLAAETGGVVNVGSGVGVSVAEVVTTLGAVAGRPDLIRLGDRPTPATEVPRVVADAARLRAAVGHRPRLGLAAGLADVWGRHAG